MNTPLSRVEQLLQTSEIGLFAHQIARDAHVTEKEAKASIKSLHAMGQIEVIPTQGRWGPRYAWLAAKPTVNEPPAIPEAEIVAGAQAATTGDGTGQSLAGVPMLEGAASKSFITALAEAGLQVPEVPSAFRELVESQIVAMQPTRYAVSVPRRPLRIVKTRARAEALALAAVRRGAKGAEVFALAPVGRARRGAEWVVTAA